MASELLHQGAFPYALRAVQHQDRVELAAGMVHPLHSRAEGLHGHCLYIVTVICAKVIYQQSLNPLHAIPRRQTIQILPDRVKGPVVRDLLQPVKRGLLWEGRELFQPGPELHVVGVIPDPCLLSPWKLGLNVDRICQKVGADTVESLLHPYQSHHVVDGGPDLAFIGPLQVCFRRTSVFLFEFRPGRCRSLFQVPLADLRILRGECSHRSKARQLVDRRIRQRSFVPVPEKMDPHQVEGIA